jgi:hypothetical protein
MEVEWMEVYRDGIKPYETVGYTYHCKPSDPSRKR